MQSTRRKRELEIDPQQVAQEVTKRTSIARSENDVKSEREELLILLTEYTRRVDELTKELDSTRQRSSVLLLWLPIVIGGTLGAGAWVSWMFPFNEFVMLVLMLMTIVLALAAIPTAKILLEQTRRIKLLRLDLDTAGRQLERIIEVATPVEQFVVERTVERLEFDLRLTDAEEKLRYISQIK